MEKLIFERSEDNFYHKEQATTLGISHLGSFFTDDVGCHNIEFYKEWLNNPEDTEGGGNYSHLEKQDGKVIISFEYDWFYETPGAEVFELTIEQLDYILDHWKEVCEKKPKKVIITRDNDKVTVELQN